MRRHENVPLAQLRGPAVEASKTTAGIRNLLLCPQMCIRDRLNPVYRRLLKLALEELQLIERQISQLDQEIADLLRPHQDQVQRLALATAVAKVGVCLLYTSRCV